MYVNRSTWYPILGKEGEMRSLAAEYVKDRQARGQKISLSMQMYSPSGSALVLTQRASDLAEMERIRAENLADSTFQAALAAANSLSRAPNLSQLLEVLVPVAGPGGPPKYTQIVTLLPAPGKMRELAALVEEQTKSRQSERPAGMAIDIFGLHGSTIGVNVGFQSLADLEGFARANRANAAFRDYQAKVSTLVQSPPRLQLFEVLIPMPPG